MSLNIRGGAISERWSYLDTSVYNCLILECNMEQYPNMHNLDGAMICEFLFPSPVLLALPQ